LQECFGTLLNPKKSLVNDFEHKFNLSCEIAVELVTPHFFQKIGLKVKNLGFISLGVGVRCFICLKAARRFNVPGTLHAL
jgi:hypothetical protein